MTAFFIQGRLARESKSYLMSEGLPDGHLARLQALHEADRLRANWL